MSAADELRTLQETVEQLKNQVGVLEDTHAIRRLQHAYGYYIDKCLYDETVDLFAEDGEVCFMGGRFKGKAGVARLYIGRFRKRFHRRQERTRVRVPARSSAASGHRGCRAGSQDREGAGALLHAGRQP